MGVTEVEHLEGLPVLRSHLDDEAAALSEVRCRVGEGRDLTLLRRLVADRVEDDVGERELALDARRRVVPDRDWNRIRLLPQLRDHVGREVDACDAYAA